MYTLDGDDSKPNDPQYKGLKNWKMVGIWRLPALGMGDGTSLLPINPKVCILCYCFCQFAHVWSNTDLLGMKNSAGIVKNSGARSKNRSIVGECWN